MGHFKSPAEAAHWLRNDFCGPVTAAADQRLAEIANMLDGGQKVLVRVDLDTNTATRPGFPGGSVRLAPAEAELLSVLADSKPHRKGELMAALYGGGDWPETADNGVNVRLSHLRRKLRPLGLTFACHRGLGGRLESKYQLIEGARS